jgi:hypothetical protein
MAKLFNVRLSKEEADMVDELRRQGVIVSDILRTALRSEYVRRQEQPPSTPVDLLEWLQEKHPAPAGYRGRPVDTTDRRKVSAFLRSRLRAKPSRRKPR